MKDSWKTGITFGVTSGIITTLGLMVGLESGTQSKLAVIGGIIIIAIADALSDSLGVHISKESENTLSKKELWEATLCTFFSKFALASTFLVPVLLFELTTAIIVSVAWGLALLAIMSFLIARQDSSSPWMPIAEHVGIALLVIFVTHYVGDWVAATFA